jgi:squalene cyclase
LAFTGNERTYDRCIASEIHPRDRSSWANSGGRSPTIDRAAAFLLKGQTTDGTWRDFRTLAGEGEDWTTAYVGVQLGFARVKAPALRHAVNALLARQRSDGGWGYGTSVPSDGDSTAWALLYLARRTHRLKVLRAGVRCMLAHQDSAGGVRTYASPHEILRYMQLPPFVSLSGWTQPEPEVTAVAGLALYAVTRSRTDAVAAAWRFVRADQKNDGGWVSYWWTTRLYATAQAVAFACSCPGLTGARAAVRRAAQWAIHTQRSDGGWSPRSENSSRAFDTALGLAVLSRAAPTRHTRQALRRGISCLQDLQLRSGGFPSAPILRIPPPGVTKPRRYQEWRSGDPGTGILVTDHHSLFTTATVVGALALAERASAAR